MALMNKLIFFLLYFGYGLTVPILGQDLPDPPHYQAVNASSLLPKPYYQKSASVPILGQDLPVPPHYQVVNVSSLLPKPYCQKSFSGPAIGSKKLEIVSRHGPCYPHAKISTFDSEQLKNWDQAGVPSPDKKLKTPLVPIKNEGNHDHGDYTVTIGLGTPRQDFNLMVDTGSTSTWVRCKSCTKGCKPNDPLYDSSKSSTYTNDTSLCNAPFDVGYGDKSSVNGIWGCDTLTGDDQGLGEITKFQFGCGQEMDGDFGDASGILGLGRGESSVTSQIGSTMHMFSYFIPLTSDVKGNLYFGNEAREKSNACSNQFTPLVKGREPVYYYVDLVGISVGGKKLNVPSKIFTSQGTVIDSGTVITRLPKAVYSALRAAFRQSMSSYTLIEEKVDGLMDTCYNVGVHSQVVLPDIKFHFGKTSTVDVTLSKYGTIWTPNEGNGSIMCLAFAATKSKTIIGSVQQRGLNVLYDLEGERIGFGTNCA